jgi:DNA-binding Lrp family transcriptional regulator
MNDIATPWMDETDRRLVVATQAGLPLEPEPYAAVARAVGIAQAEVLQRLQRMLDCGWIRRIGAVPNHYALGFRANGMSVWDVDDARVDTLGARIGALRFVSHCYRRPRVPPDWRYNLFAMVHGRDREEVEAQVGAIAAVLGDACRAHEVLYSTRILKKTGVRLKDSDQ